ncbi:O-antigen ligase like membrane family protein [Acinetobacter baumannii 573719]|nr:O-antigen ligase like membrane family protein [Acinetobacter baumannii 573719]
MVINQVEYKIARLGLISALFGYAFSFHSVYFFHLVVLLFLFYIIFFRKNVNFNALRIITPIFVFFIYSAFTLLWVDNLELGVINLFYIFCGLFAAFFTVLCSIDLIKLQSTFKILVVVFLINCVIGVCESLNLFRLPMSPYSPYASFFGYKPSDLNELYSYQIYSVLSRPTGFYWNPNNFGFVFILSFPFLFFYNKFLKYFSLFFLIFFNYFLQSKGLFISSILFFLLYFSFNLNKEIYKILLMIPILLIVISLLNFDFNIMRISTSFDSLYIGLDNIKNGNINLYSDSTDIRSSIYALGIQNLLNNPLLGLGLGGMQSFLISIDSPIQSFHFYFLEVLINYGIIFYFFFIFFYFLLVFKLYKLSKIVAILKYKKIILSVFYSLIILPIASISPSSIVYILAAWTIIGFALAILFLGKKGAFHD